MKNLPLILKLFIVFILTPLYTMVLPSQVGLFIIIIYLQWSRARQYVMYRFMTTVS